MMKAIITGATGTPYAHGCYEFDIFCENNYPNGPPKMNLMTTGAGQIRFNPNLYACGKVCLSLLGTWRGNATENWDPKLSTILQVLLSTQAIIMSEEVYFNEPGFEQEAGTVDGEKRNEGYMNIVRWGNVKFAMLGQIKNPSKGFETAIYRHFYIKKAEILKDVHKWVERAEKTECLFTGLVCDHNHTIAKDFQKSKTRYKESLTALVKELEDELHKLDKPTNYQVRSKAGVSKREKKKKAIDINEGKTNLDAVDVSDDKEMSIDTTQQEIDVNDEKVKDRWSRYIGAMGVEAVSKQAAANIFLSGAGAVGIEIAKNLVLAGCKSFTLHDTVQATVNDLSGQFYISQDDIGKNRADACLNRL
jgi:ubiquitin-protein ligase/predicted secreted protein